MFRLQLAEGVSRPGDSDETPRKTIYLMICLMLVATDVAAPIYTKSEMAGGKLFGRTPPL